MNTKSEQTHIERAEMAAYYRGDLAEKQECRVEKHFAECEDCVETANQFRTFSALVEEVTAPMRILARQDRERVKGITQVVQTLQGLFPQWRERLQKWLDLGVSQAEAAVRVIMGAPGKASQIVTDGLESIVRPQGRWQFELLVNSVRTLGDELQHTPPPPAVALQAGKPQARVSLSGPQTVSVRVDERLPGHVRPLVLLLREDGQGEPRIKELELGPDSAYLIARFENVPPGEYWALFEPL